MEPDEAFGKLFLQNMALSPNYKALQHRRFEVAVFKFSGNHSSHLHLYLVMDMKHGPLTV
jgi:hypothetical protein